MFRRWRWTMRPGVIQRKHLVMFYGAYSRSVAEWSVAAWGLVSPKALKRISVVETRARHFALGGGSTGICWGGLAALLGGMTPDVRLVMLRAATGGVVARRGH